MKRTPWFPPEIAPVRKGWYECAQCAIGIRHYWNGKIWPVDNSDLGKEPRFPFRWRGLVRRSSTRSDLK